jgi:hypothetical protein
MQQSNSQAISPRQGLLHLPVLVLAGGCLNGFAVRVAEALTSPANASLLPGISPFELIVVAVAGWLMAKVPQSQLLRLGVAEGLALAIMLVPSSSASWLAVAGYAAWRARSTQGAERTGALLILALGLSGLWSSQILRLVALPLVSVEAAAAAQLLMLFRDDIVLAGNVIASARDASHSLIVMVACSSAEALPKALTAALAIACALGGLRRDQLAFGLLTLVLIGVVANVVRLAAMAWSGEMFALVHGPIGASVYDALQTGLVLAIGAWMSRS